MLVDVVFAANAGGAIYEAMLKVKWFDMAEYVAAFRASCPIIAAGLRAARRPVLPRAVPALARSRGLKPAAQKSGGRIGFNHALRSWYRLH